MVSVEDNDVILPSPELRSEDEVEKDGRRGLDGLLNFKATAAMASPSDSASASDPGSVPNFVDKNYPSTHRYINSFSLPLLDLSISFNFLCNL